MTNVVGNRIYEDVIPFKEPVVVYPVVTFTVNPGFYVRAIPNENIMTQASVFVRVIGRSKIELADSTSTNNLNNTPTPNSLLNLLNDIENVLTTLSGETHGTGMIFSSIKDRPFYMTEYEEGFYYHHVGAEFIVYARENL